MSCRLAQFGENMTEPNKSVEREDKASTKTAGASLDVSGLQALSLEDLALVSGGAAIVYECGGLSGCKWPDKFEEADTSTWPNTLEG